MHNIGYLGMILFLDALPCYSPFSNRPTLSAAIDSSYLVRPFTYHYCDIVSHYLYMNHCIQWDVIHNYAPL